MPKSGKRREVKNKYGVSDRKTRYISGNPAEIRPYLDDEAYDARLPPPGASKKAVRQSAEKQAKNSIRTYKEMGDLKTRRTLDQNDARVIQDDVRRAYNKKQRFT